MAADPKAILARYEYLLSERRLYEPTWQEIANFILPRSNGITFKRAPGAKATQGLFDSTAIHANQMLASAMQGALTNAAVKWFRLKTRDRKLNDVKNVAVWLDDCASEMYLAFQQSNFNAEMQEVYVNLGAFGNGAFLTEERYPDQDAFSGFRFHALKLGTYVIAENGDGIVDTYIREIKMSVRAAVMKWGLKNVGDGIKNQYDAQKLDNMVTIVHAVYPRKDGGTYKKAAKAKPWASCYVHKDTKHLISESGYDQFNGAFPRWTKDDGEVYGRGQGHTAIPDVKTLNKARELTLKAWAKAIDPPMKARNDGVVGQVKIRPGDVTTLTDMDALQTLENKSRFDVGQIQEEQVRNSIREMFFNSQLQLPSKQYMTATEVERAYELMHRLLGPTIGRLESELLNRVIEYTFGMMLRRQALPPMPAELKATPDKPEGEDVDVEYEGPLARAQRSSDAQAIELTLQDAGVVAQMNQESLDVYDFDAVQRFIANRRQMPPQLLRDKKGIDTIRNTRAQAQQAQAKQQALTVAADAAGKAAPALQAAADSQSPTNEGTTV